LTPRLRQTARPLQVETRAALCESYAGSTSYARPAQQLHYSVNRYAMHECKFGVGPHKGPSPLVCTLCVLVCIKKSRQAPIDITHSRHNAPIPIIGFTIFQI